MHHPVINMQFTTLCRRLFFLTWLVPTTWYHSCCTLSAALDVPVVPPAGGSYRE